MGLSPKFAGLCGLLAPAVGWLFIFASVSMNSWFSWRDHALSHLGSPRSVAPMVFNTGLTLTGLLGLLMTLGLADLAKDRRGRAGRVLLAVAMGSLVGVGLFPWPHPPGISPDALPAFTPVAVAHTATAASFFLLVPVSLILAGRSEALRGRRLGRTALLLGFGSLAVVLAFPVFVVGAASFEGVAIPEALAALFMSAASVMFGTWLLRGGVPAQAAAERSVS